MTAHPDKKHQPRLIYLHLLRTAGSSLCAMIRRQYGLSAVLEFNSVKDAQNKLSVLSAQPDAESENIDALIGLFNFEQRLDLPNTDSYITMLRNPIDRIVSSYYYIINRPEHELHHRVTQNRMSLMEFVQSGISPNLDNHQTRFLSGIRNIGYGKYSSEAVAIAKSNLQGHFTLVGLTEKFDETAILLKRCFNWMTPFYGREKVNQKDCGDQSLPTGDLAFLQEFSRMDIELYECASALFDKQVERQGDSFEVELESYRQMNRFSLPYLKYFDDEESFDRVEVLLAVDTILNLIEERQIETAERVLKYALGNYPDAPDLHSLRAVIMFRMGQVAEARAMLLAFTTRWPSHPGAHFHLGNLLKEVGEEDRSLNSYLKALQIDPNHKRTVISFGRALMQSRRWQDARTIYSFYLKNNPRDEEIRCLLDNLSEGNQR
ncbi:MAG: tetratricopeptide repeat protein [bacterium]|nr:tetratricopeptide repeat protein [bacterium]